MSARDDLLPLLWERLVDIVEVGHDTIVMAQRRPSLRTAKAARSLAEDFVAIARAAEVVARRDGGRS